MRVEIWSDVVCPWCYIGRRRFEKALDQFEYRDQVEVIWRSFQLDPNTPREYPGSIFDMLMQMHGLSRERSEAMHAQLTELAAKDGLDYRFDRVRPANSWDAHRLLHLAAHHGVQSVMKERLQRAYFTDGLSISDPGTLVQLAVEIGLDAEETRRMLEDPQAYADAVRSDIRKARVLGISGVPFFVMDEKYGVSGAQATELFLEALERAWADAHPVEQSV